VCVLKLFISLLLIIDPFVVKSLNYFVKQPRQSSTCIFPNTKLKKSCEGLRKCGIYQERMPKADV
jgi:hypothetical protein